MKIRVDLSFVKPEYGKRVMVKRPPLKSTQAHRTRLDKSYIVRAFDYFWLRGAALLANLWSPLDRRCFVSCCWSFLPSMSYMPEAFSIPVNDANCNIEKSI